jgi:hypothetical protein
MNLFQITAMQCVCIVILPIEIHKPAPDKKKLKDSLDFSLQRLQLGQLEKKQIVP